MKNKGQGNGLFAGELLKRLRLERGWTQSELAGRLGTEWNANRISLMENNKLSLSRPTVMALAAAIGVRPERFYIDAIRHELDGVGTKKIGKLLEQMDRELEELFTD